MSSQPHSTADDLEDAALELIFVQVCAASAAPGAGSLYRHSPAIPLVCKRWAEVYAQSTVLWGNVWLDWSVVQGQAAGNGGIHIPEPFVAAAAWLAARLPFVRRLTFLGCAALADLRRHKLFPSGLCSSRLQEVHFLGARGSCVVELALLHGCPAVQSVSIACLQQATGPSNLLCLQGEALQELAALPALRSLDLHVDKITGSMIEVAPSLAGLTRLVIRCRMESAALAPDFLEGLSQLLHLDLTTVRLAQFTPRLARALGRLSYLACSDVLAAQPRRRAGIQLWQGLRHLVSLQELRLENQMCAGMPENALACMGLQGLTLLSCHAKDWPLLPRQYAGEAGCLGRLQSLQLVSLHLTQPMSPQLWALLAPSLTSLSWHNISTYPNPDEPLELNAPLQQLIQAAPVPAELALLQQLRELRLEYAQLDSVPPAVLALTCLTRLSLDGNRITALPEGQYLTGLSYLSLANNALEELPEGLTACRSLRELLLAGNNHLVVSPEAGLQLAAALLHLQCMRLSLNTRSSGTDSEENSAQVEGLRALIELLGERLVVGK